MSQNLQNFVKFQNCQLENLVDFEKCCKTHIFLGKSEPIQPKTSNILPKFCQPTLSDVAAYGAGGTSSATPRWTTPGGQITAPGTSEPGCIFRKCIFRKCIFRKFCKFLAGSFSAVSKQFFARKYAFDSIFQALQDLHPFAPRKLKIFAKKSV